MLKCRQINGKNIMWMLIGEREREREREREK